jgi:hypothetical protein
VKKKLWSLRCCQSALHDGVRFDADTKLKHTAFPPLHDALTILHGSPADHHDALTQAFLTCYSRAFFNCTSSSKKSTTENELLVCIVLLCSALQHPLDRRLYSGSASCSGGCRSDSHDFIFHCTPIPNHAYPEQLLARNMCIVNAYSAGLGFVHAGTQILSMLIMSL